MKPMYAFDTWQNVQLEFLLQAFIYFFLDPYVLIVQQQLNTPYMLMLVLEYRWSTIAYLPVFVV